MSLYNMLFGVNSVAPVLLATLGLSTEDVPRFRDCYVEGDNIVIYTRTGGGNRDYYESEESCRANYPEYFDGDDEPLGPWNEDLRSNPHFVEDEDDDFDCTYAYFRFSIPGDYSEDVRALASGSEDHNPSEKWRSLLASLQPQQS